MLTDSQSLKNEELFQIARVECVRLVDWCICGPTCRALKTSSGSGLIFIFVFFQQKNISASICIGREIRCPQYAGFLIHIYENCFKKIFQLFFSIFSIYLCLEESTYNETFLGCFKANTKTFRIHFLIYSILSFVSNFQFILLCTFIVPKGWSHKKEAA